MPALMLNHPIDPPLAINSNQAVVVLVAGVDSDVVFEAGGIITVVSLSVNGNTYYIANNDAGFTVNLVPTFGARQLVVAW